MPDRLPKFKATVEIELRAEDIDQVSELIPEIFEQGDPADDTDAMVWVRDVQPVEEAPIDA